MEIHGGEDVEHFEGEGRVAAVVCKSGLRVEAEAVVVGVGAHPDVSLAKKAGLEIGERGGVVTDSALKTSAPDVWAAGDIAEYDSVVHNARIRIEHWDVAENQGKTAARSMLGSTAPHDVVPYFFSDLSDWAWFEYVGPAYSWTEEIVRGSLDEDKFTVWYLDGDRLVAALSVDRSDDLERARELIASGEAVDRQELLGSRAGWRTSSTSSRGAIRVGEVRSGQRRPGAGHVSADPGGDRTRRRQGRQSANACTSGAWPDTRAPRSRPSAGTSPRAPS